LRESSDHFSSIAKQYAQSRPTYPAELFVWLAANCAARDLAWDVGAGSGQAAIALAAHYAKVLATDLSADQLAQAPANPRVEYLTAPTHESGLPDGCADLVTVAQALHWFDVARFHDEARRVLKPSGVIAEWTYGVVRIEGEEVNALVDDFYTNVVGPYWPAERRHVENEYAELPFPFRRIAAPAFAMRLRWNLAGLLGYLRSWSATARMQAATGVDPVGPLRERLASAWGRADLSREISWPLGLRVGAR
jgi:ubiquinone/menaquinone biosynthesis C-methylase UbiE